MYAFISRYEKKPLVIRADNYEKQRYSHWWQFWVVVNGKRITTAWIPDSTVEEILPLDAHKIALLEGVEVQSIKRGADGRFVKAD